jgi:hypothetical protein
MAGPDDSLSPEKKLLKLIEESEPDAGKSTGGSSKAKKSAGPPLDLKSLLSPAELKARFGYLREWLASLFSGGRGSKLTFARVNAALKICVFVLLVVLVIAGLMEFNVVNRDYQGMFIVESQERADVPLSRLYPLGADVFSKADEENIFVDAEKRFAPKEEAAGTSLQLVEFTQNLKLTGISENPRDASLTSCMIEDLQKDMTYFLRVGDSVAGLNVTAIEADGVTLSRGGEEVILR